MNCPKCDRAAAKTWQGYTPVSHTPGALGPRWVTLWHCVCGYTFLGHEVRRQGNATSEAA